MLCSAAPQLRAAGYVLSDASSRYSVNFNNNLLVICFCLCLLCSAAFSKTCCCCCCILILLGWLGSAWLRPLYSSYNFHNADKFIHEKFDFFLLCLLCCCRSIKIWNSYSYMKLLNLYIRTPVITYVVLSRHSRSAQYGLDQIIILRTTKQFFSSSLWKAPHYCIYELIYTVDIYMLCRVWGSRATWMSYDIIPRDWAIYMSYQGWAIFYNLSTHHFPGWAIWATDELARDLFDVCKTTTQTEVKGLHCLRFNID